MGFGSSPDIPPPQQQAPPPSNDADRDSELARQRRALERRRIGRSRLVVNPARPTTTGIRIPPG